MKPEINYQTVVDTLVYDKILDGRVLFTESSARANTFMSVQCHLGSKILADFNISVFFKEGIDTRYRLTGTELHKAVESLKVDGRYILVYETATGGYDCVVFSEIDPEYIPTLLKDKGKELKNMLRKGLV